MDKFEFRKLPNHAIFLTSGGQVFQSSASPGKGEWGGSGCGTSVSGTVQYAELITTQHGDLQMYIYLKVRRRKPRTLGDLHVNVYRIPLL